MHRTPWTTLRFAVACLLIATSFGSTCCLAQEPSNSTAEARQTRLDFTPITKRFEQFVADQELSGAVLLVGNAEKVLYHEAIGKANLAQNIAMRKETLFRIASMTKPITAIAIMKLQEQHKLQVNDAVEKYLPAFKGQKLKKADGSLVDPPHPITLRNLLTHTSGLAPYSGDLGDVYRRRHVTLADAVDRVAREPLQFVPGSKWSYCNSGIDTLGRIVEVVSGKKFEQYLADEIFTPLGMANTSFFPNNPETDIAMIYDSKGGKLVPANAPILEIGEKKHPVPAGGLYSTAGDLAKLYQAVLMHHPTLHQTSVKIDGTPNRFMNWKPTNIPLTQQSVAEMTKTQTANIPTGFVNGMSFGYGWAVVKEPKGVTAMLSPGTFGHGGAFGTQAWIDPKQNLYFVMLIQRVGLPNADASEFRRVFQELAITANK